MQFKAILAAAVAATQHEFGRSLNIHERILVRKVLELAEAYRS
jgi:hypothetical protein